MILRLWVQLRASISAEPAREYRRVRSLHVPDWLFRPMTAAADPRFALRLSYIFRLAVVLGAAVTP